ncbi:uncharacterized protein TEOVI_000892700 [Trypanosoma equiperdum]|uniref:Uncharacterized protein n=1 Tax=Trypanosoma equiperdum TaxID=5694 RepID=A0A1G4I0J6_TRYEQ|nr:hypothetical protein TEOVI_000892700 [Trypanosoma equiperdum]
MNREKSSEIKKILNEMESIFETESYLQKRFDLNISHLEEETIAVISTGIKYAATMEEMYRIGFEAVCTGSESRSYCENGGANAFCRESFIGKDLPEIIAEFEGSIGEKIDLSFQNGSLYSTGGKKLADKVDAKSTSYGHIFKHRGIRGNLGRDKVKANKYQLAEMVNVTKLFESFLPHLKEINNLIYEVETMPSKLSERTSRIDTLSDKLQHLFSSLRVSSV